MNTSVGIALGLLFGAGFMALIGMIDEFREWKQKRRIERNKCTFQHHDLYVDMICPSCKQ